MFNHRNQTVLCSVIPRIVALFAIWMGIALPGYTLTVVNVTSDPQVRLVTVNSQGETEGLQKLTVQFSAPLNPVAAMDTFSYQIFKVGVPDLFIVPAYASLTPLPVVDALPPPGASVNLWFNRTTFPRYPLEYNTAYRLHIANMVDAEDRVYLDDIPDFFFRTPPAVIVPEPSSLVLIGIPSALGLMMLRRKTRRQRANIN